jgi:branched-subunit amino acid transport protein
VNELFLITGMILATFLVRYLPLAMSGQVTLAPGFLKLLNYVPPTVLTAIVAPAVLMPQDAIWLGYQNARLIGAVVAVIVSLWQENLLLTIVAGMASFLIWQWLV